jgi:hypothetical protein
LALVEAGGYADSDILSQHDVLYKRLSSAEIVRELVGLEQRGYVCRGAHERLYLTSRGEDAHRDATQSILDHACDAEPLLTRPPGGHVIVQRFGKDI